MDITGLLTNLIRAELELPEAARQPLRPGDILQLEVLEVISPNRVRVDLGKFQAVAEIQSPAAPGDRLEVEVEAVGKQVKLRALSPNDSSSQQQTTAAKPNSYILTRYAEPLRQDIGRLLTQIQADRAAIDQMPGKVLTALKTVAAHLEPLHPGGDVQALAARVKERVESSGLFLEKKLEQVASDVSRDEKNLPSETLQRSHRLVRGDLKAQLIVLKQYFESPANMFERISAEGSRQLNRMVTGMLSEIVDQQNSTRQTDPNQLFHVVLYDLPIRDGRRGGMLKMYFPKKGRHRHRNSFRLSLLLSLDRLGDIRSDFVLQENGLTLMFFVAHQRTETLVTAHLENMKKALSAFFPRVFVSVTLAEQKLQEFETDFLQVTGDRQIDMRV